MYASSVINIYSQTVEDYHSMRLHATHEVSYLHVGHMIATALTLQGMACHHGMC